MPEVRIHSAQVSGILGCLKKTIYVCTNRYKSLTDMKMLVCQLVQGRNLSIHVYNGETINFIFLLEITTIDK